MPEDLNSPNNSPKSGGPAEFSEHTNSSQVPPNIKSSTEGVYSQPQDSALLSNEEQKAFQEQLQQQPVFNTPPVTGTDFSSQTADGDREGKSQKTILLLAVLFFVFSLASLGLYIFSGIAGGRFAFSFWGKKEQPFATVKQSPALSEGTPLPTLMKGNLLYNDDVLSFEHPVGTSVVKTGDNLWLVKNNESDETILAITPAFSQEETVEDFLVSEVLKLDKKLDKDSIKKLISKKDVGNYAVYSYTLSDNSSLFVFEDKVASKLIKISDFSYKMGEKLEGNVVETIVSTFSFVKGMPSTSPSPATTTTPTATTRLDIKE